MSEMEAWRSNLVPSLLHVRFHVVHFIVCPAEAREEGALYIRISTDLASLKDHDKRHSIHIRAQE